MLCRVFQIFKDNKNETNGVCVGRIRKISRSFFAVVIGHMPNISSLKEKWKKDWYNSPRTTFTTFSYTTSGLSNGLINMTATVVQSCPEAIELEPW